MRFNSFQDLLTQPSSGRVSPELLEMLGKKASQMFLKEGKALNDGIEEVISDHPELQNEHVRRIVEMANTTTFQDMFENGPDKNVHFKIADPGTVIRNMKDGSSPAHDGKTLHSDGAGDFRAPPSGRSGDGDAQLSEMFAPSGHAESHSLDKLASGDAGSHLSHSNPVDDVYDAQVRAEAVRDSLKESSDVTTALLKEAQENLYQAIKSEIVSPDGAGLGGAVAVLDRIGGTDKVAGVMGDFVSRLISDGVGTRVLETSLTKTAGRIINPAHPLVTAWRSLEKLANEQLVLDVALSDVSKALRTSNSFIKSVG